MAAPGETSKNPNSTLIDELESSFMNCVSLLTGQQHFSVNETEETKNSIESALQKFLELSRETEAFFLRKKMLVSFQKPEQLLNDDIGELRAELARKEQLLERHAERLKHCQSVLQNTGGPAQPVQPPPPQQPAQQPTQTPQQPSQHTQQQQPTQQQQTPQQTSMPTQHVQPPPTQHAPMGTPPMSQYSPHHIQQPSLTQQGQSGPAGMGSYQGYNTPPMHGPPSGMQQHPMGGMGPRGQGPPSYPQGPLAFLEQTTSNIGLPDRR